LVQARSFFDRAFSADPGNVEALIGSARADALEGAHFFVANPLASFAAAETKLSKALSLVTDHALGHMLLGLVEIVTKRAAEGIDKCEHALALDRNLAHAHSYIGLGKILTGRPEETEAHISEALRLSPRDTTAYVWMSVAGIAKNSAGSYEQAVAWSRRAIEATEIIINPIFGWPLRSHTSTALTRRVLPSRPVSHSIRPSRHCALAPPGRR
jgi:tetratricopeptide (TPR) repeat protein